MARLVGLLQRGRVQIWLATFLSGLLLISLLVISVRFIAAERLTGLYGQEATGIVDTAFPWGMAAITIVLGATITAGLSYLLLFRMVAVVADLREMASELSKGNYVARLPELPAYVPIEAREFGKSMNRLADALQGHERMRRDLIGNLAHELRTPLTNLQGYLEGMRDGVIPADEAAISSLHEESLRLSRLVDGLHQIAQAEALCIRRLEFRPIPLDPLVSQLAESLSTTASRKGIEVAIRLEAGDQEVPVHAEAMAQVVRNVLLNAHQYTEAGGWIHIRTLVEDGSYRLRCTNGPTGARAEDLNYLFHRFYRGKNAVHEYGAGLGLPLARELVQAHGGGLVACISGGQFAIEVSVPLRSHGS